MATSRVKQEEEADARIIVKSGKKYARKERGHYEWEKIQTRPNNSAKELTSD